MLCLCSAFIEMGPRYHTNAPKVAKNNTLSTRLARRRSFQWNGNRILCVWQPVSVAVALWSTAQFVRVFVGAIVVCSPSQFNGTAGTVGATLRCRIESDQATRVRQQRCIVRPFSRMCSIFGGKKPSRKSATLIGFFLSQRCVYCQWT